MIEKSYEDTINIIITNYNDISFDPIRAIIKINQLCNALSHKKQIKFFVAAGNEKQQQELIMNFFIVFNLSNQPEVI